MKWTEIRKRNGVKVRVYRADDGAYVDADCQCFGSPQRSHSTEGCPLYRAQRKASEVTP